MTDATPTAPPQTTERCAEGSRSESRPVPDRDPWDDPGPGGDGDEVATTPAQCWCGADVNEVGEHDLASMYERRIEFNGGAFTKLDGVVTHSPTGPRSSKNKPLPAETTTKDALQ